MPITGHNIWLDGVGDRNGGHIWDYEGTQLVYTNWSPGQPMSNDDCIYIDTGLGGSWSTASCLEPRAYICEHRDGKFMKCQKQMVKLKC